MKEVYQYIDDHREEYIEWLRDLCRQPSVAAQNRGMETTATMVEDYLRKKTGAVSEQLETSGFPVVFGELDTGAEKTLSFYNHYDVQPEDPIELWESDPFSADIRDGKMYARGVADNKGNLMARICAVHAYTNVYGKPPVNVKFIFEGEEEIGSVHLEEFADRYPDKLASDGCIWEFGYKNPNGQLQVSLGVKGMLYVELEATGANTDLHSANAAVIENPAWKLIWALSTLKNAQEEILIDGFYDRVHAPTPIEKKILEDMNYEEDATLSALDLDGFLLGLSGMSLKEKLLFQPTCTICGIESGYTGEGSKTVLPSKAKVKLDFRLVGDQDPNEILDLLKNHLNKNGFSDINVTKLSGCHPAKTDPSDPLVSTIVNNVERVYSEKPVVLRNTPGTGPMYDICQKQGIPAVSLGVGNENSRNHAPNENIAIQDYIDGIKMMATIVHEFANDPEE
ncbi:M20/M25/M40 family metallo-hydrolase [Geomicrobium sp. JCM 19039]|uniref:M20/M25/M40 family metallo-hydrolase n=1 Tax=Geomicrobium sp. JCM 19039 TaxID=1460636 RepID=UPI00045F4328|nr:M20/M25/M40 family metallo-hydrolase [Geomicrobium sp. JCM 19039]GAK14175.1 acetylornithine deacetylase/succinyl-diaminopimelate desuccinylase and related deacylase [Geomicrobium sp. JCM 19039]